MREGMLSPIDAPPWGPMRRVFVTK